MRGREGIRLGSYQGAPIVLAYSWFVALAFIFFVLGPQFSRSMPGFSSYQGYVLAFIYALMLLLSVFIHEMAHAIAAHAFKFSVQKITLNIWGGLTQFQEHRPSPSKSLITALVGPAANFALAGIAYQGQNLLANTNNWLFFEIIVIFMWTNIILGVLNVVPAPPLDGSSITETIVWKITGSRAQGMIVSGWTGAIIVVFLIIRIATPILRGEQLQVTIIIITAVIISILWVGSTQSIHIGRSMKKVSTITAYSLARKIIIIDPFIKVSSLKQLMHEVLYDPRKQVCAVIEDNGKITAIVDDKAVAQIPQGQEEFLNVDVVLQKIATPTILPETLSGQELLQQTIKRSEPHQVSNYIVVNAHNNPVGFLNDHMLFDALAQK